MSNFLSYNVRKYHYADGVQIRFYDKTITVGKERCGSNEIELDRYDYDDNNISIDSVGDDIDIESSDIPSDLEKEYYQKLKEKKSNDSSVNRTIQSIYGIARSNKWDYFITLTINPKKLDNTDYSLISKKTSKWLENLKMRKASELKYIIVPELHKDGSKWHMHGLISNIGNISLVDSSHVDNKGNVIYNLEQWKYGFSTATKIVHSGKASSYIIKYINKDLVIRASGKRKYWASKNCLRAKDCLEVETMTFEEKERFLQDNAEKIQHMKVTNCVQSGQTVRYLEMGCDL